MGLPVVNGLEIRQEGPIIRVIVRREPDNKMSMAMCSTLSDLLYAPPDDARIMHLRAEGPAFCLGRDRGSHGEDGLREEAQTLVRLNRALRNGKLITVAEVTGDAAGYGVGLAALSDLSFAAPSARFWFPEVETGLAPTVVLSWLPSIVGRSQAFRLAATGVRIDGRQAAKLGLVTDVAESRDDLPRLVAAEIGMLRQHSVQPQLEIRAFLQEAERVSPVAVDQLSVERLVANSLRLEQANAV
jgi:methylglutaconyl-CoA hydratase